MRLLIDLSSDDPHLGLAIDEALFESVRAGGQEAVRCWIDDCAVIVGRSQVVADEVDEEVAEREGIPVLRRISGGGTVVHYPGNLNLSIVLRDGRRLGSVGETFTRCGGAIATGVAGLGPTIISKGNDLMIGSRKVGGAAQARRGDALLYHTTLMVRKPTLLMDRLLCAMQPDYRPRAVASRPRRTAALEEAVEERISVERVVEAVVPMLSGLLDERLVPDRLDSAEARRARTLARTKYKDPAWNRSM